MNSSNRKQSRLFSALASIDQTDRDAAKRRKTSHLNSLQQSKAASDQTKINSMLLELRILIQRCMSEGGSSKRVREEVDTLLGSLLDARRQLAGHELDGRSDGSNVNYAHIIKMKSNNDNDDTSSSSSSEGTDLASQLQSEYESLEANWKKTLNEHHSKLAIHSGMTAATSKFQSKAVDISFWEQVQSGIEHDKFKRSSNKNDTDDKLAFDDSKLYQQLLKDFISSSSAATNKKGVAIDPAQEAATRLKRAMRKKGDNSDLSTLLTDEVTGEGVLAKKKSDLPTVDRRASKGRKIRYTVIPKLVNFTFPVPRQEPKIKEDVWFKSLFGGAGKF